MTGGKQVAGAGFQFTAAVLAGVLGGNWLDRKLGTSPWLLIVMVFAGAAIGLYSLYRNNITVQRWGDRRQTGDRRE
jgi:ATP synthase protein I